MTQQMDEVLMAVYYINLLLIAGLAYPLCLRKPTQAKKLVYLLITFGYMWFLAAYRVNIGFDYHTYIRIFERFQGFQTLPEIFSTEFEPGFALLNKLLTLFVTSPVAMYGVYAAIIYIPVIWFIFRYSQDAWLSTWLYVTTTYFYSSMNFIRQNIACGIVLLGYGFLRDKKPIPYFLVVLLGATFHKTALIMIPIYFFAHIPLSRKMGIFYGSAAVTLFLFAPWIIDFMIDYPLNFLFSGYKNSIYVESVLSPVFLLVPFVIFGACLSLLPAWRKRDPNADLLTNLMMFSAIIWLFITRSMILERFSHYAYMLSMVAVPAALRCLMSPPEAYEQLAELKERERGDHKKGKLRSKEEQHKLRQLAQDISDHRKYYWSAVAALALITFLYNEFGQHVNGFHNVFPYQSVFEWLNTKPPAA